jgi:DNA end-binding protein Ku
VAKFVMRDRQYLGLLRVRDGLITLEQLHFADEIRPVDDIRPKRERIDERELAMAVQLIASYTGEWRPDRYEDTYRAALCDVIRAKRKGKAVRRAAPAEEEAPPDLLAALRASVAAVKGSRAGRASAGGSRNGGARRGRGAGGDLGGLSKAELQERAKRAGIPGRTKMSKDELVDALSSAA